MEATPTPEKMLQTAYRRFGRQVMGSQIWANLTGALIVTSYFAFFYEKQSSGDILGNYVMLAGLFPILVLIANRNYRRWEKDLQSYVSAVAAGRPVSDDLRSSALRKILDQPFVAAALSGLNWLLAAVVFVVQEWIRSGPEQSGMDLVWDCSIVFVGIVISGCVTIAIIYFAAERHCRRLWPLFFRHGSIEEIPGALRLRLRHRMLVIFILTSILPVTLMAVLSFSRTRMLLQQPAADITTSLLAFTAFVLAVTVALAIVLSRYFASGILGPIKRMETAMQRVATGDFKTLLPVDSNDELGALSVHFNRMTDGLREREQMKQSLELAKEVQQSLLPATDPVIDWLDIAGSSKYCDETGGDYFDYLDERTLGKYRFGVVVGDVSGHGLPSALMMATVRAAVRQRAAMPGSIGKIVTDVNRQFSRDVEQTGGFVTLFCLVIDAYRGILEWVRAGHDPGWCYSPAEDRFDALAGDGIAVGLTKTSRYPSHQLGPLAAGQVILLGTDGIWETRNPEGEMFGKKAVRKIIRQHHASDAGVIQGAILDELSGFRQHRPPEDDVTLVVVKIRRTGTTASKK